MNHSDHKNKSCFIPGNQEETKASLIAAAPQLLEALQMAVERLEMNNCEQSEAEFINSINIVIAKATGQA